MEQEARRMNPHDKEADERFGRITHKAVAALRCADMTLEVPAAFKFAC